MAICLQAVTFIFNVTSEKYVFYLDDNIDQDQVCHVIKVRNYWDLHILCSMGMPLDMVKSAPFVNLG